MQAVNPLGWILSAKCHGPMQIFWMPELISCCLQFAVWKSVAKSSHRLMGGPKVCIARPITGGLLIRSVFLPAVRLVDPHLYAVGLGWGVQKNVSKEWNVMKWRVMQDCIRQTLLAQTENSQLFISVMNDSCAKQSILVGTPKQVQKEKKSEGEKLRNDQCILK